MCGAGWRVSKELLVPLNIRIVLLPPHSPELNPRSACSQWRHAVRNRLHLTLESVTDAAERCSRKTTAAFFRSICRCSYL
jgi:hypothetical protein